MMIRLDGKLPTILYVIYNELAEVINYAVISLSLSEAGLFLAVKLCFYYTLCLCNILSSDVNY